MTDAAAPIKMYKGFDEDWTCRGFKYELGKTYTHDGDVSLCNSGFHACEAPLDVWNYYSPVESKFAEVDLGGVNAQNESDTKRVGSSITIKAALDIAGLVSAQIEWTRKNSDGKNVASGNYSTAASSGNYSTAASSGNYSKAASSGNYSKAASSGNYSTAASSGHSSTAASSGHSSTAASSGNSSTAASSGDYSKAACDTRGFACVAGINGAVKGNAGSALSCGYRDGDGKNRIAVGYVGENGIKPDTFYRCDEAGKLVAA